MNIASAVMFIYPGADPIRDFEVWDKGPEPVLHAGAGEKGRGPYIAAWNLDEPQPTEAELQSAWKAYQEAEANKPPVLTETEQLQKENLLLKAQINAQTDRSDFIEDIIAEMAMQVYQ